MGKSQRQKIAEQIQREELADELRRIIQHARRIRSDKQTLRFQYNKWYQSNQKTIKTLTELKDNMLTTNTIANTSAGIANLTEIFGGVLSIAGAIADKRDLMEMGQKITKGGNVINVGTFAIQGFCLKDFCERATKTLKDDQKSSNGFEQQRYSYFQQLECFKQELRTPEATRSFPLLLETAQREGIDFLGDLGLDDDAKSILRTNLRQMCRSDSKKIKASTEMVRTHEGTVFASQISGLLFEFKELLDEDGSLLSIFSEQTKKFLGETIDHLVPYLDLAESSLRQHGTELLSAGISVMGMRSDFSLASRAEVGLAGGMDVIFSTNALIRRINDINDGSKSPESEELAELIEEMKVARENIIEGMREIFGWEEPICATYHSYPALEY